MKRDKNGLFESELEKAQLVSFWIEGADRSWLKREKDKRKISLGALLRYIIKQFKNK